MLIPLAVALAYHTVGWVPIPLRGKLPLVKWSRWQTERPSIEQVRAWWTVDYPHAGVGLITGAISRLAVVDLDGEEGLRHLDGLPETATVRTPRGRHCYFLHPGHELRNAVGVRSHVDLRADGGLVAAPGSPGYTWIRLGRLAPLPAWVIEEACASTREHALRELPQQAHTATPTALDAPIPEGRRRDTLWRLGRRCRLKGWAPESIARKLHKTNAQRCQPPLPTAEVEQTIRAVLTAPDQPRYARS